MRPLGFHIGMRKAGGVPTAYWGLCFTAEQDGSTVAMNAVGSAPAVTLETSVDGEAWEPFYVGSTVITLPTVGDKVYFRAGATGNDRFATADTVGNRFVLSGQIAASGDVMSLLNGDESTEQIQKNFCFASLFNACRVLTSAPELPATGLTWGCYSQMFIDCSSLTIAPKILPATTPQQYCYGSMFRRCTALVVAPELALTSTVNGACLSMFNGCRNLNTIKVGLTSWGAGTPSWLASVAATGTFYCPTALGTNETITRGTSACPEGWTVINTD